MKVVAFNGSPHKKGNTYQSLLIVCDTLEKYGIDTEIIQVGGRLLQGCIDCRHCRNINDRRCGIASDDMNALIESALYADGLLIGSPVFYGNITPETKCLIDRLSRVARSNGYLLKRKPAAAVVTARRNGGAFAFSAINYLFHANQMIVPGSSNWNYVMAGDPGEWQDDGEGIQTLTNLGENMAWLIQKLSD